MVDYENATPAEIAQHFRTVTRQRIQQILRKFAERSEEGIVEKIHQAKKLLKVAKYRDKRGCTVKEYEKAASLWGTLQNRVGRHVAYLDCVIDWRSEAEFREWAVRQTGFMRKGFELDKDILVKGNRVYGPDTCVFIPQEMNTLLSGCYKAVRRGKYPIGVSFNKGSGRFVAQMSNRRERGLDKYLGSFPTAEEAFACYKAAKELRFKQMAEKWKDHVDPRVYEALMKRTVEWDD